MSEQFVTWLNEALRSRGWSNSELARRAGIAPSAISMILSGQRGVGPDICNALARALDVPPSLVFQKAELLPNEAGIAPGIRELSHLYDQLNDQDQKEVLTVVRALVREKLSHYEPQTKTAKS
jgi:transcriptional regulator with XRE-family HTH domain